MRPFTMLCALFTLLFPWAGPASSQPALTTVRVASGLKRPLFLCSPPGDLERLFIVQQGGRIAILRGGKILPRPFLDLSSKISSGGERGLLGLAFHPGYRKNGFFFVNYTERTRGDTVVERYRVSPSNPDLADPSSGVRVIRISQPFSNHNGGMLAFGPRDGYLYIATGDGGGAFDPNNNAQNGGSLLGKILRIDVDRGRPYAIPPSNPFRGPGNPRDEIWALGLRNPWRFSFDRALGDLYIADVGQSSVEEVDFQPASSKGGENYGWRCMEGRSCTGRTGCTCNSPLLTLPIHQYTHALGCSITGGYVYRGCAIPGLGGTYFFADYCSRRIWSFRVSGGKISGFKERTTELAPGGGLSIGSISSFGEDATGELYLLDLQGGEVFKIVPRKPLTGLAALSPPRIGLSLTLNLTSRLDPGKAYICPFSLGFHPGIPLPGARTLPLNPDLLFTLSLSGGIFKGTVGYLGRAGKASVVLSLPKDPVLVGLVLYSGFLVLDPARPLLAGTVSCPLLLRIGP